MLHPRPFAAACALAGALLLVAPVADAQRHSFGSSPPTAPPPPAPHLSVPVPGPIAPISQGLGPLQFIQVNYGVLPPQALTRQLQADDERTRAAALSSVGAPGQYLAHGHVPYPHSIRLDFVALGTGSELDAILTVELDQHLLSAILRPDESGWRRIASILYASSFADQSSNPGTFLRTARSVIQPERYRAVFRGSTHTPAGDLIESEANLRVLNDHAVITLSFTSEARICSEAVTRPAHSGCELTQRWIESDATDPAHRLTLVTATGHQPPHEASDTAGRPRNFLSTRLRQLTCQPFVFSETSLRFEPSANAAPCTPPDHAAPSASLH